MIDATVNDKERITIPVSGMTCAACQARVQRALTKSAGVREANVNLMLHNATVEYDPAQTSPERIVDAIRATGYDARVPEPPSATRWSAAFAEQEQQDRVHGEELRELTRKAVFSLAAGIVGLAFTPSRSLAVTTTNALYRVDVGIKGRPLF